MLNRISRSLAMVVAALLSPALPSLAAETEVTDADISSGSNVTWTADNTYVLAGLVFVDEGATLTIEAGTVIKGQPGQGENASALVVARGGKIFAEGTAANPIIFTSTADDVTDPNDLPLDARGLWGGVIILGKASLNSSPGETPIEGIEVTETRGLYGGSDDADNSGVFRYVSIRYGGTDIGSGNEINGLTMGGVGSGTVIDHVEVANNADDGFEWFGGTVNASHLVVTTVGDDAFDYDEGWRGKGQFWFALQASDTGNRAGEHDGGTDPEDGTPYATPTIYNVTYIGSGADGDNGDNDVVLKIRDNAGGQYHNSIFTDFVGEGVDIEDLDSGEDSRSRLEAGDLLLANNIWWGFGSGNTLEAIAPDDWTREHLTGNGNEVVDPQLTGISRTNDGGLDPRPMSGSPALSGAGSPPDDGFFQAVGYRGAFDADNLWVAGWTFLDDLGILVQGVETVVASESATSDVPSGFSLVQNYPNPWNPSTTISYSLPQPGEVELSLYNALGQQIATLVSGFRQSGTYRVELSGEGLSSGTYFYRLQSPAGIETRSMTLLK